MRLTLFFLLLVVVTAFGGQIGYRFQRATESLYHKKSTKEQPVKGTPQAVQSRQNLENRLRKGEYVCGNKICKLRPEEIPPGCNGMCQYPVH